MNPNELEYNLGEILFDSTNLLHEMSQMSSKNTRLYQDYPRIFDIWKQKFFKHMYLVFFFDQKFEVFKEVLHSLVFHLR